MVYRSGIAADSHADCTCVQYTDKAGHGVEFARCEQHPAISGNYRISDKTDAIGWTDAEMDAHAADHPGDNGEHRPSSAYDYTYATYPSTPEGRAEQADIEAAVAAHYARMSR